MIHECVLQLRGEADGRQVDGARVALAHLVGGGSVCTVNLLGTDGRSWMMATSDERRAAGKEIQGQLWPATLTAPDGAVPGGQAGAGLLRLRAADRVRR